MKIQTEGEILREASTEELSASRSRLVERGTAIMERLSQIGKAHPERDGLVEEKMLLDRRLSRINKALKARHVGRPPEFDDEPPEIDRRTFLAGCALAGLLATGMSSGAAAKRAWEVAEEVEEAEPPEDF